MVWRHNQEKPGIGKDTHEVFSWVSFLL